MKLPKNNYGSQLPHRGSLAEYVVVEEAGYSGVEPGLMMRDPRFWSVTGACYLYM